VSQDLEDTTPPQGFMMDSSTAFEILHPKDMTGAVGSVEENTSDGDENSASGSNDQEGALMSICRRCGVQFDINISDHELI